MSDNKKEQNNSGLVRRIDDLGRVVIPKEIREKIGIKEGDAFEIYYNEEGVFFRKYEFEDKISLFLNNLDNAISNEQEKYDSKKKKEIKNKLQEVRDLINKEQ